MDTYIIDFETTFSSENTLSKCSIEGYVRNPKFEVIGLGWRNLRTGFSDWIEGGDNRIRSFLHDIEVDNAFIAHHAQFDGFICSHTYNSKPAFWYDTLSMSRALYQHLPSHSLDKLVAHFNLGTPKTVPYNAFRGKTLAEIEATPSLMRTIGDGCLHDIELAHALFNLMLPQMPEPELELIDETVRLYTEPVLTGDVELLSEALAEAIVAREQKMHELGLTDKVLKSDAKFATLLRGCGVEPPTKMSNAPTKLGQIIYAFAKSDKNFTDLLEHPDERVRDIVEARIAAKTSIHETGAAKLLRMAELGPIPVYEGYYGCHTGRPTGGDKFNFLNMPKKTKLRSGLLAPNGHILVWADLSQIEFRMASWLADDEDLLDAFREGRDIYSEDGTDFFKTPVSKDTPELRFLSKETDLGSSFGMGPDRFHLRLQHKCKEFGIPVPSHDTAKMLIKSFRRKHPQISKHLWGTLDLIIKGIGTIPNLETDFKCVSYVGKRVILPNGMYLDYSDLHWHVDEDTGKKGWRTGSLNLWGGSHTENLAQSLAWIICANAWREMRAAFRERGRGRVVLAVYDELVCCVPLMDKQWCLDTLGAALVRVPEWAPGLPLAAELFHGPRYDKSGCEPVTRTSE